ncbi:MAG: hypothetical protein NXI04_01135 [Planctomycetaceae bacterium]|nr:hypothetical protein [Planctomycetaceae bacterium]
MSTVETPTAPAAQETCPRCHTTEPWGQSSWCPVCNYYPVVDAGAAEGQSWSEDLPETPQEEVDNRTALESIPGWFWGMLVGVVVIAVASVGVRMSFAEDEGTRGLIALIQLSVGLVSMITAHGIASKLAFATDRRTNFNDVLLSWFSIWQPTIGRLPASYKQVWAAIWGAIAVITATTIIGGIDYSAPFRTHKKPDLKPMNVIGKVAGAARAGAANAEKKDLDEAFGDLASEVEAAEEAMGGIEDGPAKSIEDALNEVGDMDEKLNGLKDNLDADGISSLEDAKNRKPERDLECFVYGVVIDEKKAPVALLFAANTRGQDQHVAEIKAEDIPKKKFRDIALTLYRKVQRNSEVPTTREAVWVKPDVYCRLKFVDFSKEGELNGAVFDAVVVNQRSSRDAASSLRSRQLQ